MGWLKILFGRRPRYTVIELPQEPKIIMALSCFEGLGQCLEPSRQKGHEGVALLLGYTDGVIAYCVQAVQPKATTSRGSFHISAAEIAMIVGYATKLDLQIVGQVHTHPGEAYHSDGDEEGANIRFHGFMSVVIPNYGVALPSLANSAIYMFTAQKTWQALPLSNLHILDGKTPR